MYIYYIKSYNEHTIHVTYIYYYKDMIAICYVSYSYYYELYNCIDCIATATKYSSVA